MISSRRVDTPGSRLALLSNKSPDTPLLQARATGTEQAQELTLYVFGLRSADSISICYDGHPLQPSWVPQRSAELCVRRTNFKGLETLAKLQPSPMYSRGISSNYVCGMDMRAKLRPSCVDVGRELVIKAKAGEGRRNLSPSETVKSAQVNSATTLSSFRRSEHG